MPTVLHRILFAVTLVAAVSAAYLLLARPYQLHWGATDAEIQRAMPGDELEPRPTFLATRAITIDAPSVTIFPWLLQMGYGRAGFYGYDILENAGSPRGLRSAERIEPELQGYAVGDVVPISAVATMMFYAIEPDEYLIWAGTAEENPGGFTWALYPVDAGHTRLVSRIRWRHHWSQPGLLALDVFTDLTDHLAVRKVLQGVKDRAEGRVEPMARQNVEFAIYVATFLIFVAGLFAPPLTRQGWLAGLLAGAAWLVTWYAPGGLWIGPLLVVAATGWVWRLRS